MPMYPKSAAEFSSELFQNPTSEYRGAPFWSWNSRLTAEHLLWQIDRLKEMGLGGFHMHPRTGMATEYMSAEYMDLIKTCVEKARNEGMKAYLYDEDRWPSGFAGGLVTAEERYRLRHLLWTSKPFEPPQSTQGGARPTSPGQGDNAKLLARYEVVLDGGRLVHYRRLVDADKAETTWKGAGTARIWWAYLQVSMPHSWYNNQTYADTLSVPAISRFLEVTHDRYAAAVGKDFGGLVPSIFTDEPQHAWRNAFGKPEDTNDRTMPFTDDLPQTYQKAHEQDLLDHLPEIFWELPAGKASQVRYRYHNHVTDRFVEAFAGTIGAWCDKHDLALTGHMMSEQWLDSQTGAVGEAMRSLAYFQLPGIDLLCDSREYTTAKQAQSPARQFGRPGVMSELYGVTNWDFDFIGHKAQGDWQAALGITLRVPHLSWVSMAGESKRDYPAAIDEHSPWYKEYPLVENHFARVNIAMTRGKAACRVAVVHPIESFWLCFGPISQTKAERDQRERDFQDTAHWLLHGLVDFDYISEALLPDQLELHASIAGQFSVGAMTYDVVVVPGLRTIRGSTLDRLECFVEAGGRVVFAGQIPDLVDAFPSVRPAALAARCQRIALARKEVLEAVAPFADVRAFHSDGAPSDALLYQLRRDGDAAYIFLCNTDRRSARDVTLSIRGRWNVRGLDTFTGTSAEIPAIVDGEWTTFPHRFEAHGSLLLQLTPVGGAPRTLSGTPEQEVREAQPARWREIARLSDPVPVTLSEPNVLLLDIAEWRVDNDAWRPAEEILRLDNLVRERLNLKHREGGIAQPWTDREPAPVLGDVTVRYTVVAGVSVDRPLLAMENAPITRVSIDGQAIVSEITGYYVDKSIQTIALPSLPTGTHTIELSLPFTRKTQIEASFLLGDFSVTLAGRHARLGPAVTQLAFGDIARQGLPFYGGNVTYQCAFDAPGGRASSPACSDAAGDSRAPCLAIEASKFKAPLLTVALDGKPIGPIAFAPFRVQLGDVAPGRHTLAITAFGNRINTFGALHNCDETTSWHGPDAWRSAGSRWSYEYQVRPTGLMTAPIMLAAE